jgi:hypothetical protein
MQPPADGNSEIFCMREPDVPLLNKVLERKTPPAIHPGRSDGQPQVVLEELPAGLTVARSAPAAKVCSSAWLSRPPLPPFRAVSIL